MPNYVGLSGSVILSAPDKFHLLFKKNVEHIEIGEFPSKESFDAFLKLLKTSDKSFGLHSPLFRNQSKYDLLEKVQYEPDQAWEQFEKEVEHMSRLGAEYILVHFPYFKGEKKIETNDMIESGLRKLQVLQEKYSIPIVCEPKLGQHMSTFGIESLDQFPVEVWDKYGINLCIDIGDYLLATKDRALDYMVKWKKYIKVVHLHNVEFQGDKYIWIPVHPSHESDGMHFNVEEIIKELASNTGIYFVFEHTPHSNPTEQFVDEGIKWVAEMIGGQH
ncbi:TIM barrel protein [Ornithinibacillus californiensis]|uniref:TIM barrel protein n=1 Tax=Ornithinibacillus californiensis TaxID=161536 RepID=UPI00064DF16D|nr:TIM barrel protein [Ornithinibacillus californiensis]